MCMCLVSGSLRRILKFQGMTYLTTRFCRWLVRVKGILLVSSFCDVCSVVSVNFLGAMFAFGYSRVRISSFFLKKWHISSHLSLKAASSLLRMEWHFLRVLDERTNVANSKWTDCKLQQLLKIYLCCNCSPVGCLKYVQFHHWFRLH